MGCRLASVVGNEERLMVQRVDAADVVHTGVVLRAAKL